MAVNQIFSIWVVIASLLTSSSLVAASHSSRWHLANYEQGRLFSVQGSNTLGAKLMPAWAEAYLRELGLSDVKTLNTGIENEFRILGYSKNGPVYIDIAAHGSSTGFKALSEGACDLAMSSRVIKSTEQDKLRDLGDMRKVSAEHVVGIDGLAVVVHRSNKLDLLSIDDIAAIFSGEIRDWSELGAAAGPIHAYARDENSGTWDTFNSLVLDGRALDKSIQRFESNDKLSDLVANDPQAIGFVGLASVRYAKALAIADGFSPALRPELIRVATEDYPLARRLYLYSAETQNRPRLRDFINFVQERSAQKLVEEIGFVSLNPIALRPELDIDAPQEYLDFANFAQRLSINFRFKEDSAELDNRSLRDIDRLIHYFSEEKNKSLRIQLIGFGDFKKSEERTRVLSMLRASAVKVALHQSGITTEPVLGLGTYLPVASNLGKNKSKNQRVEVWVFNENNSAAIAEIKKSASLEKRQVDTQTAGILSTN